MRPARRWLVFLSAAIAAIAAVLAVVLPLSSASAAAVSAAGTRVGASPPGMIFTVGASHAIFPGQGRCIEPPQPDLAAGACVAPEDGGSLADAAATCGGMSFGSGTKVLLASGATIPISQLKPGEKVLATNVKTGRTQAEPVTEVLEHHDSDRYDLRVQTPHGSAVIQTTSSHLFWDLTRRTWVKATDLRHGDHLRGSSGNASVSVVGGYTPRDRDGWMWDLSVPGGDDHEGYSAIL